MKAALIICIAIIILPLVYLATDYVAEFAAVDSCLDSGGSYDYDKKNAIKKIITITPHIAKEIKA